MNQELILATPPNHTEIKLVNEVSYTFRFSINHDEGQRYFHQTESNIVNSSPAQNTWQPHYEGRYFTLRNAQTGLLILINGTYLVTTGDFPEARFRLFKNNNDEIKMMNVNDTIPRYVCIGDDFNNNRLYVTNSFHPIIPLMSPNFEIELVDEIILNNVVRSRLSTNSMSYENKTDSPINKSFELKEYRKVNILERDKIRISNEVTHTIEVELNSGFNIMGLSNEIKSRMKLNERRISEQINERDVVVEAIDERQQTINIIIAPRTKKRISEDLYRVETPYIMRFEIRRNGEVISVIDYKRVGIHYETVQSVEDSPL
jgi:hypothetical protein